MSIAVTVFGQEKVGPELTSIVSKLSLSGSGPDWGVTGGLVQHHLYLLCGGGGRPVVGSSRHNRTRNGTGHCHELKGDGGGGSMWSAGHHLVVEHRSCSFCWPDTNELYFLRFTAVHIRGDSES